MSEPRRQRRPAAVTAVTVLCWVLGVLLALLGVLVLVVEVAPGGLDDADRSRALLSGILFIATGLIYAAVGFGLSRGVDWVRVVVLLNSLLSFGSGAYSALTGRVVTGVLSMLFAVLIVVALWNVRSNAFFEKR